MNNNERREIHVVVLNGKAVRGFLSAEKAEAQAERYDAAVERREMVVGQQVEVHVSSHAKRGVLVRFDGPRHMVVRVRLAAKEAEKRLPIEF